ncbi:RES family NAD+ phosphorylase [Polaromonas hydrogenivorans]|uniref:RES family NAD+ phosphorylase n=1 Tax=Polaromonas hydrogenivorans TaxID=335476 RepID=A0AAU7LYE9_9BURK
MGGVTKDDSDENYVCYRCVDDDFLQREMKASGKKQACSYCRRKGIRSWTLQTLADRVQEVFDEHFQLSSDQPDLWQEMLLRDKESDYVWFREGEEPQEIIASYAEVSREIAIDIVEIWSSSSEHDPFEFDEDPFGDEARYIEITTSHGQIESSWSEMQDELLHRTRFFSKSTVDFLEELFNGIQEMSSYQGTAVQILDPTDFDGIYRARIAETDNKLKEILEGVPNQLGAQWGRSAKAGRMNAAGVTALYGAFDAETCIAEVRAPVGSQVVIGKFKLLRPLKILNLKHLENIYKKMSLFDPNFHKISDKMHFLRSLSSRLSVPVFSDGEQFDYLITQVIAEFLASIEPRIDGVAFASAQSGGESMNVVLFAHACEIKQPDFPQGTKTEFSVTADEDDDLEFNLVHKHPYPNGPAHTESDLIFENETQLIEKSTLELDFKSIQIRMIKAVKFTSSRSTVHHSELTGDIQELYSHQFKGIDGPEFDF